MILEHIGDAYLISWHGTTISGNIHWAGCDWWRWNCTVNLWAACLWYNKRSSYLMLEWWFPRSYSTGSIWQFMWFFLYNYLFKAFENTFVFQNIIEQRSLFCLMSDFCFLLCFMFSDTREGPFSSSFWFWEALFSYLQPRDAQVGMI